MASGLNAAPTSSRPAHRTAARASRQCSRPTSASAATAILDRHLADRGTANGRLAIDWSPEWSYRDTIDAEIARTAPQYPVGGLAPMDRSLLRCAIGEVLHSPTPARVAIAEWVELARTYSGDPMRRLMNGVLGRIASTVGR
jgi:hypothetical protein